MAFMGFEFIWFDCDFAHKLCDFGYFSYTSSSPVFKRLSNSTYLLSCEELVR